MTVKEIKKFGYFSIFRMILKAILCVENFSNFSAMLSIVNPYKNGFQCHLCSLYA